MSKKDRPNLVKNQELVGDVIDLTYEGLGVVKIDDFPIFVSDSLPGEKISFAITRVLNSYAFARVLKRLTTSPDRVISEHADMIASGIAPLVNLAYPAQLAFKREQVRQLFHKAGLDQVEVLPTIGMANPTHYRNKTVVPIKFQQGRLTTGFYRRGSHKLVPISDYYLNDPKIDAAVRIARDVLNRFGVSAYDEITREGLLRYLMVRRGYVTGQMMLAIVATGKKLPQEKAVVAAIKKALPDLTSLILNYNPKQTNVQLGLDNRVLYGSPVIHDTLLGLDFEIGVNSFYQVNPQTTAVLYQKAAEMADLAGDELAVDAYSGIGTIGLYISSQVKKVIGVEVVAPAVADAEKNMQANHIQNAEYIAADAPEQFVKWAQSGIRPDVVFVDPPRKGLSPELIEAVGQMQPQKFVYVSCNTATLVRDVVLLRQQGYQVTKPVQPIDQFPQTMHVECVLLMTRVKN
ncbi:MAG: 23S rRNA (uracil(1939)-C(5))-methyltransferase RlmD [Oenococcus sp.]|uniref:23S rRNA (uracil(1939)-C(5))-methyltransferase RlmD n=1 Tax=Oenococcus sp. TaxID=1979414 RepID=UPI0039E905DF